MNAILFIFIYYSYYVALTAVWLALQRPQAADRGWAEQSRTHPSRRDGTPANRVAGQESSLCRCLRTNKPGRGAGSDRAQFGSRVFSKKRQKLL